MYYSEKINKIKKNLSYLLWRGNVFEVLSCGEGHYGLFFETVVCWHSENILRVLTLYCDTVY